MTTNNDHNDTLDIRLDTLLAANSVAPKKDFADTVIAAIAAGTGDELDLRIDNRLEFHPLRATPERTERLIAGVQNNARKVIQFRRFVAWTLSGATAACLAFAAMTNFIPETKQISGEALIAQAMENDPELARILKNDASAPRNTKAETVREMAQIGAGLNGNSIDLLESLTQPQI